MADRSYAARGERSCKPLGMSHDPALDGLRGVAIALVMALHADLLPGGWVGVSLFFTLSGFLITRLLVTELAGADAIDLRAFYRRRVVRLAPALLLALLGMLLIWAHAGLAGLAVANAAAALLYVANLARAVALPAMVPASWAWTLSLEEQFYATWPPVLRMLLPRIGPARLARRLLLAAAAVAGARLVLHEHPDLLYTLVRGDELLVGAALALTAWQPTRRLTAAAVVGLSLVAVLPLEHLAVTVTAATACCGIVLASADRLRPWLSVAPLRYLGRISYALYLWNGVITAAPGATHASQWVAVPLAVLSTHLVEEPLRRRWGRRRVVPAVRTQAAGRCG